MGHFGTISARRAAFPASTPRLTIWFAPAGGTIATRRDTSSSGVNLSAADLTVEQVRASTGCDFAVAADLERLPLDGWFGTTRPAGPGPRRPWRVPGSARAGRCGAEPCPKSYLSGGQTRGSLAREIGGDALARRRSSVIITRSAGALGSGAGAKSGGRSKDLYLTVSTYALAPT